MHVFGLMTRASTLKELDEVVISANMVFSSSHSGQNVEKHFKKSANASDKSRTMC